MKDKEAEKLLNKYQEGACTEEEKALIESWYIELANKSSAPLSKPSEEIRAKIWEQIRPSQTEPALRSFWPMLASAAVLVIAIGFALTLFKSSVKKNVLVLNPVVNDVPAGGKRAFLTLADGSNIILDSVYGTSVSSQPGVTIHQSAGRIEYKESHKAGSATQIYNKITVPPAGEYELVLSDGTKVWLNSASSISFPVTFKRHERNVALTGEAYFEVAKNKEAPFKVFARGTEVQVLGTHFNVSAYAEEHSVTTTLLEGAVRVSKSGHFAKLSPGQQSSVSISTSNISVSKASVDDAVAWKNGYFSFSGENLESMLKKVARWYDVEIVYQAKPSPLRFGGIFSKRKRISELLKYLEKLGENKFKIEGRRVVVMK